MHQCPRSHQMKWSGHSAFGRNAHVGHISHLGGKQCWGYKKNDSPSLSGHWAKESPLHLGKGTAPSATAD